MSAVRRATDLYGLPLDQFTSARDELAQELRRAGKRDAADEVKALRKPPVSAWAVNQAVRRQPQDAKALIRAGAELRKAQRSAIAGKEPAELRTATRAHRDLVEKLTDAARDALGERGAVTPAVVLRIAQTLRSASVDKDAAKSLASATLSEDVEQTGFGPLLAAARADPGGRRTASKPRAAAKAKPAVKPKPDPNRARKARLREQLRDARNAAREERRGAERAVRRAEAADRRVTDLEAKLAGLDGGASS